MSLFTREYPDELELSDCDGGVRRPSWLHVGLIMFSVLIPSFNHQSFLAECVLSALHSPLVSEILIIDDGSRDQSPELLCYLERLSHRIKILANVLGEN